MIDRSLQEIADRIARLTETHEMLSHMATCQYDDHLACPITSTYPAQRVDTRLKRLHGHVELVDEPPISAIRRMKSGPADAGPDT